jgi:hypothetical protein
MIFVSEKNSAGNKCAIDKHINPLGENRTPQTALHRNPMLAVRAIIRLLLINHQQIHKSGKTRSITITNVIHNTTRIDSRLIIGSVV